MDKKEVEERQYIADVLGMFGSPWQEDVWCTDVTLEELRIVLEEVRKGN